MSSDVRVKGNGAGAARAAVDADAMRRELSKYLDTMKHKLDDEGNPFISFPDNFDSIAAAMDRDDLVTEQEKPWSRYLLENSMGPSNIEQDQSSDAEEEKKMLEQRRLQQGLAEIQMLDKQLKAVAKRDSSSRRSALALTLDDAEFGADGDTDGLNSGRSSAASSRYGVGKTFLTRLKSDIYAGEESRLNSARTAFTEEEHTAGSPTPRTHRSGPASPSVDLADSLLHQESTRGSPGRLVSAPMRKEEAIDHAAGKKNFLEDNKHAIQGHAHLTLEQQMRVSSLLGFNDMDLDEDVDFAEVEKLGDANFEAELLKISRYGYSDEEAAYMAGLDERLRILRDDAPLEEPRSAPAPLAAEKESTISQPNYLVAQRAERTREAYTKQIDTAIRYLKRPMNADELMGLVDRLDCGSGDDEASDLSKVRSSRRLDRVHSVRDIPRVEDVSPGHLISMEEVLHVIDELCHPEPLSGLEGVPPAKHKSISVAPRADLDALLSRLRPDIIQLASLRSRKRDLESRSQINSRMTELFVKEKAFPLEPDDVMHIGGGLPHEKMGIQDVAKSAAQFAEQAAAATAALIAEHNSSNHKYKSSRIRGETKTAKGMSFEPAGSDFDISRKGVASELNNESTRPTIRMRAENESKVSKKQSRANLSLSSEEEEVIYSAPSSAQSARAISPRLDSNSASYYQSSRRQQAARELIRSREATSGEATEAERGFLPLLSGTIGRPSQEASLVGRQSELIKQATSSTDRRANKKEPTRKIGSKFSSAVVRPDASSTLESHEQLNLHSRANICDEVSYISTGSLIQSRKPSRELFNLSNGLDDVHDKLSRLLARADRAHDNADDGIYDTVVDTDSDAEESLPGCDVELAGAMQKMIRNINPRAAASIGAVEKLVLRAAEETGSVLI